ncbi:MAG: DUF3253 domain-containing protein [Gammaproteobacteria bacterium]
MSDTEQTQALIVRMVSERGPDKTLCPSEVARALAGTAGDWRQRMDEVHQAVLALHAIGVIRVSQKGAPSDPRWLKGPYRIGMNA